MSWSDEDFAELGRKVQRAQHAMEQIRGVGTARGIRVTIDAENHLLSIDLPDAEAVLEAYRAAVRDKQPRVEAALRELGSDPRYESVRDFVEANPARLEAERRASSEQAEAPLSYGESAW